MYSNKIKRKCLTFFVEFGKTICKNFLNKYTSICFMKKKLHKALILYLTSILET